MPDTEYLIIGAGFSGLAMAFRLIEAGKKNFRIYERAEELGGTWAANTYPGCACDVPAHVYSFSFEQKPDWSKLFANQPELLAYIKGVAAKHDLERYVVYGKAVTDMAFNEKEYHWSVQTDDGETCTTRFVIAAAGPLATPAMPQIDGLDSFRGEMFHSANWRHDVDLTGKAVAVIGTGASAIQFVPEIVDQVDTLTVFQRTAPWVLPRMEREFTDGELDSFRNRPALARLVRRWLYWRSEMRAIGFFRYPGLLRVFEWMGKRHLKSQIADEELRKVLTPNFRFGCKRLLMSNQWYPALAHEKSEVVTAPIKRIVSDGIELEAGRMLKADVIIMGTGFHATEPMPGINVTGRSGKNLHEEWSGKGAEAFLGSSVSGYPNLFMLLGPNTGLGHNSVVYMAEAQIEGILRLIAKADEKQAATIEVTEKAQAEFNHTLQERLSKSVWQTGGCDSWYKTEGGRNTTLWPAHTFDFRKQATNLPLEAFSLSATVTKKSIETQAPE
ncbi:NAD(P)/FAD-dependent oxidoreductase [Parvularcula sp. IMCC14364]|uniref:flavin-containing monooxygenase n=1 Tax=Parvularcula sp. IMCC14364 TaxID=3067902 RepID=UPI002741F404|nr:NAD(P)/FAD-dependent oxidoreductase [Parvularcula sp. IMCC14364]